MTDIRLLKYILVAIPLVIILCALILIVRRGKENYLKLFKNGSLRLKRWFILVLILAVAYGGVYFKTDQMQTAMRASVIIGFNYPEASSGLNPNGTRFNISELLSDDILEKAITEGNLNHVTVDDLKRCFQVTPLKAGDSISTNQVYMSTEYQLTYEANENTLHLKPADVVDSVAQVYRHEFVNSYSRKTNVLMMDFSELENIDYLDIVELFDRKAQNISDYASAMSSVSAAFQSETTGETFSSIAEKIQAFRDVQLESFQAFILSNGLAKNADQYIAKLKYDNTITHKSYLKDVATHNINLDAIDRYDRDMATIVLIPSVDLEGSFYMSRTKIGVDYFAKNAEESMQYAANRQRKIQFNDYAITKIQTADNVRAQIAQAEDMLESLKSEYSVFAKLLEDTLADYDKKTVNNYVSVIADHTDPIKSEIKKACIFAIIFAIAFCLLIIALNGRKNFVSSEVSGDAERKKKRRNQRHAKVEKGNGKGETTEESTR